MQAKLIKIKSNGEYWKQTLCQNVVESIKRTGFYLTDIPSIEYDALPLDKT